MSERPGLRPYQVSVIKSATAALSEKGSAVLQMPTGSGKTRTATEIIAAEQGVVWFICHRQEIERQAAKAFSAAGIEFGIVSPRTKPDFTKRVQIVSVAAKCLGEMPRPDLVIWDECHHVPAKSWAKLHTSLGNARHLGLTATPERLDGKGLKDWFADLIVGPSISELIEQGFLSPVRYFAPSDPDLTAAKLQAGDYRKKDADAVMNSRVIIGDAVAEYKRSANGKRAIAFCTSVDASKALVDRFNDEGIPAMHVDGASSDDHRREAVAALTSGQVKVLSNVEVFTEGFDVPVVEAVILMRPTKSATLLLQMIGRALRYVEGKTAIIMDHAGLHQDHGWFASDWQWSIEGGAAKARRLAGVRGPRRCPECKEVRGERLPVCDCGYEFPTGREVGEFDGVLREVVGEVPEGCVSKKQFARMADCTEKVIYRAVKLGLPVTASGHVDTELGMSWIRDNWHPVTKPPKDVPDPWNYESLDRFATRFGLSAGAVGMLKKLNLPIATNGWVKIQEAADVVRSNWPWSKTVPPWLDNEEFETVAAFAKRVGASSAGVNKWIKEKGMPALKVGEANLVDIRAATVWLERYNTRHFVFVDNRASYISVKELADLLNVDWGTVSRMRDKGMPHDEKSGWIHIQRGLEWVRDNTNIGIPPSAWPGANDNRPDSQSAAA